MQNSTDDTIKIKGIYNFYINNYNRDTIIALSISATQKKKRTFMCSTDHVLCFADTSDAFMDKVSNLLGIERRSLEQTLLYRRISASHARRRSIFHKPCSLSESVSRRDCVAKFLYDR